MSPSKKSRPGPKGSHVVVSRGRSRARMVDVGANPATTRTAVARARVAFRAGVAPRLLARGGAKGPIEEIARAAGLLAAKRTSELIPLCHPLPLDLVDLEFRARGNRAIEITCTVSTTARTGVEMEALVGAALAALTVYDMTKAVERGSTIERLELVEKRGGKSGHWRRKGSVR